MQDYKSILEEKKYQLKLRNVLKEAKSYNFISIERDEDLLKKIMDQLEKNNSVYSMPTMYLYKQENLSQDIKLLFSKFKCLNDLNNMLVYLQKQEISEWINISTDNPEFTIGELWSNSTNSFIIVDKSSRTILECFRDEKDGKDCYFMFLSDYS